MNLVYILFQDEIDFIYSLLQRGSGSDKKKVSDPDPADQKSTDPHSWPDINSKTRHCNWSYFLTLESQLTWTSLSLTKHGSKNTRSVCPRSLDPIYIVTYLIYKMVQDIDTQHVVRCVLRAVQNGEYKQKYLLKTIMDL